MLSIAVCHLCVVFSSTPLTANKLGLEGVGVMKSPDDSTDNEYVLEQGT